MGALVALETIAQWVDATLPAESGGKTVSGIAQLDTAEPHSLALFSSLRWRPQASCTLAGAVLCSNELKDHLPSTTIPLICAEPMRAWGIILRKLFPQPVIPPPPMGVHETAVIHPSATLHKSTRVGAFVTIEEGAQLGAESVVSAGAHIGRSVQIGAHTTVMHRACILDQTRIGDECWIGPNAVIGSYGFGIDEFGRRPHLGNVVIGNGVTIGAQSCVDRASIGETYIGDGSHIDNLVQIGHNVRIGRGVVICGQAGLAGSVQVGDGVIIGGQAGIADHVSIVGQCRIAAQSGVTRSIQRPGDYSGHPAEPNRQRLKREAHLRKLAKT